MSSGQSTKLNKAAFTTLIPTKNVKTLKDMLVQFSKMEWKKCAEISILILVKYFQKFFIDGAFRVCDTNKDGWVDVDEYTELLRKFGKEGNDVNAAIDFLFGVYDEDGT